MEKNIDMIASRFLDSLSKGCSFQQLVDLGYEILGNPFAITDFSGKTIGMIRIPGAEDDPQWHELSTLGYSSADFISYYLNQEKLVQKVNESKYPIFWNDKRIKYKRILGKIETSGKQLGTVGVIEFNKPFLESDRQLVAILCKALSVEMQKDKFIQSTKGLIYEGFIRDLLDGSITDGGVIAERKKHIGLDLKKNIYILTIDISGFDGKHQSLNMIRTVLEDMIDNSKAIIYNDYIVVITSCNSEGYLAHSLMPRIKENLSKYSMLAGISRAFSGLEHLRGHYRQSMEALQLGKHLSRTGPVFSYDDYAANHMASLCAKHSELSLCCHPKILELMEYDRQNNSSFTNTLYAYVVNLGNMSDSASASRLHRNTMTYRIDKIRELTRMDLNSNELLFHLYGSFKVLEYMKLMELPC